MRTRLRRYPALGFLAVAALLASLLPSALRVPLSGPSASAELAPVPGKSDSAPGDLSALGETSTGGLGSGSGLGGDGFGGGGRRGPGPAPEIDQSPPPDDNGSGRNPRQKRCVGDPPRQTEDPLSPPCVAYFTGDNFGATTKGVTGEEIRVVWRTGCSTAVSSLQSREEYSGAPGADPNLVAYAAYFNERFQTYGRRVRLWSVVIPCEMDRAEMVAEVDEKITPFAMMGFGTARVIGGQGEREAVETARRRIVTHVEQPRRSLSREWAPFVLSFPPDIDGTVESASSFLCERLAGRPARYSADPVLQGTTRKFGVRYHMAGDPAGVGIGQLRDAVERKCGAAAGEIEVQTNEATAEVDDVARWRTRGVTTVIYMADDITFPAAAESAKWYPEWFIPDSRLARETGAMRGTLPATEATGAFGFTSARKLARSFEQPYRQAAREGCACATPGHSRSYDQFLLLFWGIQAAGPRLTPENMDRGLHAVPARRSLDPRVPAAYFATGNYSFVKDHAAIRWDVAGTREGNQGPGCWRLAEGGLRYRAEDWASSPGDHNLAAEGQPCEGD